LLAPAVDDEPSAISTGITDVADALPDVLEPVWRVAVDLGMLWVAFVFILSVTRRHWGLVIGRRDHAHPNALRRQPDEELRAQGQTWSGPRCGEPPVRRGDVAPNCLRHRGPPA
jgi:hypothetical protein